MKMYNVWLGSKNEILEPLFKTLWWHFLKANEKETIKTKRERCQSHRLTYWLSSDCTSYLFLPAAARPLPVTFHRGNYSFFKDSEVFRKYRQWLFLHTLHKPSNLSYCLNSYDIKFNLSAAFDMVLDPVIALETLISLGFQRVLTSGCDTSALEGLPLIKRLIDQVSQNYTYDFTFVCHVGAIYVFPSRPVSLNRPKGELSSCQVSVLFISSLFFAFFVFYWCCLKSCWLCLLFITGGGITERNLQRILEGSGAQEFHSSARSSKDSAMKFRYGKIKNILSRFES